MSELRLSIAIDGPASSGKGTVARLVARTLDYQYIDTGSMFRAVALIAGEQSMSLSDEGSLCTLVDSMKFEFEWTEGHLRILVNQREVTHDIRNEEVGRGASDVAVLPRVRHQLLIRQREHSLHGGVVMDGRDIGTVVLPDADLKIFLDASANERARRRFLELRDRGLEPDFDLLVDEIERRDEQDRTRVHAPLIQASDAIYIDSTHLSPNDAAERIVQLARSLG